MQNEKGITPVGQAIHSLNIEALDLLLENGADIHENGIIDTTLSRKLMKPLHYIAKKIRI